MSSGLVYWNSLNNDFTRKKKKKEQNLHLKKKKKHLAFHPQDFVA